MPGQRQRKEENEAAERAGRGGRNNALFTPGLRKKGSEYVDMYQKKRLLTFGLSGIALLALAAATFFAGFGFVHAASPTSNSYTISNNTPGFIKNAKDTGALDPTQTMAVTVWLKLHNTNQLDQLVQQQNTKGNGNYHKWIDQATFNANFAPTSQEVNSFENFAQGHKLTVLTVSDDNAYVKVSGTVGDVEKAFHTQIDTFSYNGQTYFSNTSDPNINDSSGAHVDAITGLDNFDFQPDLAFPSNPDGTAVQPVAVGSSPNGLFFEGQCFRGAQAQTFTGGGVTATYTGNRYGADVTNTTLGHLPPCGYQPSELQTAYNMTSLYQAGLDGTGQTVVITDAFGSSTIQTDAEVFSQVYGLPDLTPANFQIFSAPGTLHFKDNNVKHFGPLNWPIEITLDVEWVHAMAPGAKIDLVISPNNGSDLDEAVNYAVVHHLGNTISDSWSGVEGLGNPARFNRDNRILEEAISQGIDVNFSSGDSGDFTGDVGFKTVGFPGSSPFATSIGGTSLVLNPDNTIAFQTGWGNNLTRIVNSVPRDGNTNPRNPPGPVIFNGGAGGGASLTFAKPAFQSGLPGATRQVPDVSLLADPFTGAEFIETVGGQLSVSVIGGTSLACPMFSAIMAIASEKAGHPLGQAAPLMYGLSSAANTSTSIYDVPGVTSPNNVTGVVNGTPFTADQLAAAPAGSQYYSALYQSPFSLRWFVITFGTDTSLTAGPGWDNVTGVGTPNGANFVNALGS